MKAALVAIVTLGAAATVLAPARAHAQPEKPGTYAVDTWVPTSADNPPIPLSPGGVFIPKGAGAFAPVALVHGAGENGGFHTVMAQTLASRGVVVLAPSFSSLLLSPQPSDGDKVNALLDWAVQKSADPSSPLSGKVDGSARGVLGHSNGGVVFFAAAKSPLIKAIVSLDGVAGLDATPGFHGPSLHLLSAHKDCSGGSTLGYTGAPSPKLMATVANGDHCDVDNPSDSLCPTVCGGTPWSAGASGMFHRYAVAWIACLLGHDETVAPWIGGSEFANDVDAGLLTGTQSADVGTITCDGGPTPGSDGGALDASTDAPTPDSGGTLPGDEAGLSDNPTQTAHGCSCRTAPSRSSSAPLTLAALALAAALRRARSRWGKSTTCRSARNTGNHPGWRPYSLT
jgi:MYXO-CTERM domain-containing protein